MKKRFLYIFTAILLAATEALGLSFSRKTDLVQLTVTPEYKSLSAQTPEFSFIIKATIKNGWHLYWDNPGDSGDPTTLVFADSPDYTQVAQFHSAPKKSVFEEIITSYVYTDDLYFKTDFALKDLPQDGKIPFKLMFAYTACKENCLPETIALNLALPIKAVAEKNPTYLPVAITAENTFPMPLSARMLSQNDLLELKLDEQILADCAEAEFVSEHPKKSVLSDLPKTEITDKNTLRVAFQNHDIPPDFNGVLLCPGHAYYVTPENDLAPLPAAPEPTNTLWYYLLTAFIAGLILNLMPCVLPVLSLKALYLAAHKEKASLLSGLSYLSGVLCSFVVLAALIFCFKLEGEELGWGFQLQSPYFNLFLLALFILIFLNLIDKLPLPDSWADKLSRLSEKTSFLTGFFAVIIACPCTGPFMGAALGYALWQPTPVYFGIFTALAVGYALPYTLIEAFPHFFLRFIPKPGHWMLTLKRILALPIALTCLWLGWVIAHQFAFNTATSTEWEPYSEEAVLQARKEGTPVFIDFTAKWCLVCLLNDKSTLSTKEFKRLVKERKIRLFKADWTNKDETVSKALKRYNRNSIPLYVYYAPHSDTPQILPQILTTDIVSTTLKRP